MTEITDEWILSLLEKYGPASIQLFRDQAGLSAKDTRTDTIKRHLKSLAVYRILERRAIGGVYYYSIPGDTRPINFYEKRTKTEAIKRAVDDAPTGAIITARDLADNVNCCKATARRAMKRTKLSLQHSAKGHYVKEVN